MTKARHVPKLMRNLISIGQLDDEGYTTTFGDGAWKVSKGAMVVARGNKTGTLYMTTSCRDMVAVVDSTAKTELWHNRLGRMSENGLKMLVKDGMIPELKTMERHSCESCILGKQKRVSFTNASKELKAEKLELVHTDVRGPAPVPSLLKNKSDVFATFKTWKAMVELETSSKVKCLKSDNGGEYVDSDFKQYCAENGIKMMRTIPGTPQQNGVAERMNRTLNERARSMRIHSELPKTFWADAINTAAFLIN